MLHPPDLPTEQIVACLREAYSVPVTHVAFLPRGADAGTAVYRAVADDETAYFVKLRRGGFDETSVTLPSFLRDQGIESIIAPLATRAGQLWTLLDAFTVVLYPFVEGHDGYEVALSEQHWRDFGSALKHLHTAALPPALARRIQRERFSDHARVAVQTFLARVEEADFAEPISAQLAALLRAKSGEIRDLVARAARHARTLQAREPEFVTCHSDVHAGNVLIDRNDAFYIVDWDNPILAPKERDLMFIGGGQGFIGRTATEEERLFYQGYGPTPVDPIALAYYRYERIIQDIAAFCEEILLTTVSARDREQALRYLASNFLPHSTLELAYRSDPTVRRA